jgi:DNA-binding NarL/FixJ family response regulator
VDSDQKASSDVCAELRQLAPAWVFECHSDADKAVQAILASPPSAVLMEVGGPDLPGIECARRLKAALPGLPIVMLTVKSDAVSIFLSVLAGASGYLIKPVPAPSILRALRRVLQGKTILCTRSQERLLKHIRLLSSQESQLLSPREQQIMGCLLQNLPDKDIEKQLKIEYSTLHAHLESIYRKLNAHGRHKAVKKYLGLD